MKFERTRLPAVVATTPEVFEDARGFFMETWRQQTFADAGIDARFVQDNFSSSVRLTLRGLHYQILQPQGKMVRVVRGEIFDVAVDLRRSSESVGQWVGEVLSENNRKALWIPPGFAHGFLALSDIAEVEYKCTSYYAPEFERAVRWNDPDIGIEWPLRHGERPFLSSKDEAAPALRDAELYP